MMSQILAQLVETLANLADRYHTKRLKTYYQQKTVDMVIDVGSHKGEFICRLWNDEIPIYSFEPQSLIRPILIENTKRKNILEYFDCALSDYEGKIELFVNQLTSTTSTRPPDTTSSWMRFKKFILGGNLIVGKEKVRVTTLDKVFAGRLTNAGAILLKIDVEGAEANVVKGAFEIISTYDIAYIQLEQANYHINSSSEQVSAVELLEKYGYRVERKFVFPLLNFTDIVLSKNGR